MAKVLKRGDTVNNGALILAIDTNKGYVLCYNGIKDEFVTWAVDGNGDTSAGVYLNKLEDAIQDFNIRVEGTTQCLR
jgi:hypothetical protein